MTIAVDPTQVLQAWQSGAGLVNADLDAASQELATLANAELGELSSRIGEFVRHLDGVGTSAGRLVTELGENVDACMATYDATGHTSVGVFEELKEAI